MIKQLVTGFMLLAICASASGASEKLKAFQVGSIEEITAERNNQSFIVVLWSVNCPPCLEELNHIQQYRNKFSKTSLVLVATDGPQYSETVQQILYNNQLAQMDTWNFAGSMPEQLRYVIDPGWYGELPRTYFYDANHRRVAYSGALTQTMLERWLNK